MHFPFFRTSCKVLLHWGEPKTSLVPHMKGIWNHTFFTLFVCPFLFLICKKQKVITLFSVFLSRNSTSNTKYENDHVKLRRVRTILSDHFRRIARIYERINDLLSVNKYYGKAFKSAPFWWKNILYKFFLTLGTKIGLQFISLVRNLRNNNE